jgi:hypothetical protein
VAVTDPLARWWVHQVTVQTKLGSGGYGDKLADPVPVPCNVQDSTRTVRDADGNETVSSATIRADLEHADKFPAGSLVTLPWADRPRRVIGMHRHDSAGRSRLDHLEIHLA